MNKLIGCQVSHGDKMFSVLMVNGVPVCGVLAPGAEETTEHLAVFASLSLSGADDTWPGINSVEVVTFTLDASALSSPVFVALFGDNSAAANATSGKVLPANRFQEFSKAVKSSLSKAGKGEPEKMAGAGAFFMQKGGKA